MSNKYIETSDAVNPLELAKIKAFTRTYHTKEDDIFKYSIDTAFKHMEGMLGVVLTQRDFEFYTNTVYPSLSYYYFRILRSPVTAISNVYAYYEDAYVDITSSCILDINQGYSRVYIKETVNVDMSNEFPFKVVFTAGYEDTPDDLMLALMQYAAYLYKDRGDGDLDFPAGVKTAIKKYRLFTVL